MKKNGFTLAEVLITLTIIGVIAAITIPNLMQNYRKHERITQIKTAYSIIQNAVRMSVAENGSPSGWTYGTAENAGSNGSELFAPKYILPYLKYQYACGVYSTDKKCFDRNGWKDLNENRVEGNGGYSPGSFYQIKLQNGMDLGIWAQTPNYAAVNGGSTPYYHLTLYVFDVNGSKGPNQAGNDVFGFAMDDRDGIVRTFSPTDANGVHVMGTSNDINTLLNSSYNFACSKNAQSSGIGCTRVIELNGWEFPDNYPIKI